MKTQVCFSSASSATEVKIREGWTSRSCAIYSLITYPSHHPTLGCITFLNASKYLHMLVPLPWRSSLQAQSAHRNPHSHNSAFIPGLLSLRGLLYPQSELRPCDIQYSVLFLPLSSFNSFPCNVTFQMAPTKGGIYTMDLAVGFSLASEALTNII